MCGYNDTYNIGYEITDKNGVKASLYNFNIPTDKYNQSIKRLIIDDLITYQDILVKYGIDVKIVCMMHLNGDIPTIIDLP